MPYKVEKRGDKYCVVKEDGSKTMGCHPSKKQAEDQMRAIYANEHKALGEKTIVRFSQDEAGFVPLSTEAGQACVNCRWFAGAAEGGPYCNVIENYPLHIEANSWCKQWTGMPATLPADMMDSEGQGGGDQQDMMRAADDCEDCGDEPYFTGAFVQPTDNGLEIHAHPATKTIYAAPDSNNPGVITKLRQAFQHGLKPGQSIFKAADGARLMLIVTSNSYTDRERETLTSDALKEDVDRHWTQGDDAFMSNNPLLFWHDDDVVLGDVVWGDMIGPLYIEVAREADNPIAHKFFDYREQHPDEKWGASHRFAYFTQHRSEGGDYSRIFKKETTMLPLDAAANLITYSGVLPMSDKRAKKFDELIGLDGGYNIFKTEGPDALIKKLSEQGIEHKSEDKPETTVAASDSTVMEQILKAYVETVDDQDELVKENDGLKAALTEATEKMTARETELADALKTVNELAAQLKEQLDARPRSASRAAETQIENQDLAAEVQAALLVEDPVFGKVKPPVK